MKIRIAHFGALLAGCSALAAGAGLAASSADGFRAKLEKWVQTRQIVSEEKTEWDAEKATLQDTKSLLAEQKKLLAAEIEELEASNTQSDEERRDLLLELGGHQSYVAENEAEIRTLEESILALAPRLPEPLQDKIELLLVQIPKDADQPGPQLGQRLMNVLGILAQAEKFDSTATFVGETREVEGGEQVQVRTLYWGLGQAIYADTRGKSAGIGRPGDAGWEFSNQPEIADEANLLLDIYEGNVDTIEFVEIPVEIH